jgi:hypothetical protein
VALGHLSLFSNLPDDLRQGKASWLEAFDAAGLGARATLSAQSREEFERDRARGVKREVVEFNWTAVVSALWGPPVQSCLCVKSFE